MADLHWNIRRVRRYRILRPRFFGQGKSFRTEEWQRSVQKIPVQKGHVVVVSKHLHGRGQANNEEVCNFSSPRCSCLDKLFGHRRFSAYSRRHTEISQLTVCRCCKQVRRTLGRVRTRFPKCSWCVDGTHEWIKKPTIIKDEREYLPLTYRWWNQCSNKYIHGNKVIMTATKRYLKWRMLIKIKWWYSSKRCQ